MLRRTMNHEIIGYTDETMNHELIGYIVETMNPYTRHVNG